jgi:hypothetical protein
VKRYQKLGLGFLIVGYLMLGFFWFGPGFMAGKLEKISPYGGFLALAIFTSGIGILIYGSVKRKQ